MGPHLFHENIWQNNMINSISIEAKGQKEGKKGE